MQQLAMQLACSMNMPICRNEMGTCATRSAGPEGGPYRLSYPNRFNMRCIIIIRRCQAMELVLQRRELQAELDEMVGELSEHARLKDEIVKLRDLLRQSQEVNEELTVKLQSLEVACCLPCTLFEFSLYDRHNMTMCGDARRSCFSPSTRPRYRRAAAAPLSQANEVAGSRHDTDADLSLNDQLTKPSTFLICRNNKRIYT
jgi:hypothetical protein